MLEKRENIVKYLEDYHAGKILQGKDIGLIDVDNFIRYKSGQVTIINGLDNVGKTIWMLWYFLCLSKKHGLKWIIYSGENKSGQLVRQLIQFYTGQYLSKLSIKDVYRYEIEISNWFTFVDNSYFFKSKELFEIFKKSEADGCLIDPFTGMDREYTHAANYDFLNESRHFCNSTGKSLYVNTHVVSEAARRVYNDKHEYAGYQSPPSKSESEGGQPFGNRTDDFITIHRLVGHPIMKFKTMVFIRKIKDHETGGLISSINEPLLFDFNNGLGFTVNGQNPLNKTVEVQKELSQLTPNINFYEVGRNEDKEECPF